MKTILALLMITLMTSAYSQISDMASAQAVNTVCTEEAKTANCGDDKVGSGLLLCLRKYSKAHKDFKISDSCEASLKQLRRDVKAKRK